MLHYFFFFKQKTAYEMRISDWSSDVCSSDLLRSVPHESKRESGVSISSLVPMQPVRSMPASVEFYEKLGFEIEVRRDDWGWARLRCGDCRVMLDQSLNLRSEEHTSELQSLMRISYAVFCLKKNTTTNQQ